MSALDPRLRDDVLRRLGVPGTGADELGLILLYDAWCRQVPFDNLRKLTALHAGTPGPLPGIEPSEFFAAWSAHGVGATCWPATNALAALFSACGFEVTRETASMFDTGEPNHGAPVVEFAGQRTLVDPAMLTGEPLVLTPGRYGDWLAAEVEHDARGERVWFSSGSHQQLIPCRLLGRAVDVAFFESAYEASRTNGPFNDRLYFRRNLPDRTIALRGRWKYVQDDRGVDEQEMNRDELLKNLRRLGVSDTVLDAFDASGALQATLEAEPTPPREFAEKPPSERA